MTDRVVFTPLARADIEQAYGWYEEQRGGLGEQFVHALELVWALLAEHSRAGPEVHRDVRRLLVPRFPFSVYYRVVDDHVEVRACLHQHRDPRAWLRRVERPGT